MARLADRQTGAKWTAPRRRSSTSRSPLVAGSTLILVAGARHYRQVRRITANVRRDTGTHHSGAFSTAIRSIPSCVRRRPPAAGAHAARAVPTGSVACRRRRSATMQRSRWLMDNSSTFSNDVSMTTTRAASDVTSLRCPKATPTVAAASAGASLMPSPTKRVFARAVSGERSHLLFRRHRGMHFGDGDRLGRRFTSASRSPDTKVCAWPWRGPGCGVSASGLGRSWNDTSRRSDRSR